MAPEISEQMDLCRENDELRVLAGTILSLEKNGDRFTMALRERNGAQHLRLVQYHFDAVVNCTGPSSDLRRVNSTLCQKLFDDGLARSGPLGMGWMVDDEFRLLPDSAIFGDQPGLQPRLYSMGSCLKGQLWETIAIPELRLQADILSEALLKDLVKSDEGGIGVEEHSRNA
jgi:uncharacterized NAD(P)/FAD-binding protein YdhS